jgi:hypothetical protein
MSSRTPLVRRMKLSCARYILTISRIIFRRIFSITCKQHFLGTGRRCAVALASPQHNSSWRAAGSEEMSGLGACGATQVHHEKFAPRLLHELRENELAWEPDQPDHRGYVEMHRVIGDAVMSALAFAAAEACGS